MTVTSRDDDYAARADRLMEERLEALGRILVVSELGARYVTVSRRDSWSSRYAAARLRRRRPGALLRPAIVTCLALPLLWLLLPHAEFFTTAAIVFGALLIGDAAARTPRRRYPPWRTPRRATKVLVYGNQDGVRSVVSSLRASQELVVAGVYLTDVPDDPLFREARVRVFGNGDAIQAAALALDEIDAGALLVVPGPGPSSVELARLSRELDARGVPLLVAPVPAGIAAARISVLGGGVPLLRVSSPTPSYSTRLLKTLIDRIGAPILLVLLAPLFAAIAVAILIGDGGPVLFRQRRVGLNGEHFVILKFRTMVRDADAVKAELLRLSDADGPLFKMRADPRVSRIGRFLRRFSLDELPQLVNVMTGSMSLVGPRPPLPEEANLFDERVRGRLRVKPGMTGLWQISGRSDLPWEEAVRLDLSYVENWSLALDAEILLRTPYAVINGRGAY